MARLDKETKEKLKKFIDMEEDLFLYESPYTTEFKLTVVDYENRPLLTSIAENINILRIKATLDKMLVMTVFAFLEKDKSMLKELREYKIEIAFLKRIGSDRFMLLSILEDNIDNAIKAIEEDIDNFDCQVYLGGVKFGTINIKNGDKYVEDYETEAVQEEVSLFMSKDGFEEAKKYFDN